MGAETEKSTFHSLRCGRASRPRNWSDLAGPRALLLLTAFVTGLLRVLLRYAHDDSTTGVCGDSPTSRFSNGGGPAATDPAITEQSPREPLAFPVRLRPTRPPVRDNRGRHSRWDSNSVYSPADSVSLRLGLPSPGVPAESARRAESRGHGATVTQCEVENEGDSVRPGRALRLAVTLTQVENESPGRRPGAAAAGPGGQPVSAAGPPGPGPQ